MSEMVSRSEMLVPHAQMDLRWCESSSAQALSFRCLLCACAKVWLTITDCAVAARPSLR